MRLGCPCVPCGVVLSVTVEALLCVDWSCPLTDIVTTSDDSCELLTLASSSCQAPSLLSGAGAVANLPRLWRIYPWLYAFACIARSHSTQLPSGREIPCLHSFGGISPLSTRFRVCSRPYPCALVLPPAYSRKRRGRTGLGCNPPFFLPLELFGRPRSSIILRKVRDTLALCLS